MAGYWPSSFFFARTISSHLGRTDLVKTGFIIWLLWVNFFFRDAACSPERAS